MRMKDFQTGTTLPAWTSDAEATMEASPDAGCCPEWDEEFGKLLGPGDISTAYAEHFKECWRCKGAYGVVVESEPAVPEPLEDEPTLAWTRPPPPPPQAYVPDDAPVPRLTVSDATVAIVVLLILIGVVGAMIAVVCLERFA